MFRRPDDAGQEKLSLQRLGPVRFGPRRCERPVSTPVGHSGQQDFFIAMNYCATASFAASNERKGLVLLTPYPARIAYLPCTGRKPYVINDS